MTTCVDSPVIPTSRCNISLDANLVCKSGALLDAAADVACQLRRGVGQQVDPFVFEIGTDAADIAEQVLNRWCRVLLREGLHGLLAGPHADAAGGGMRLSEAGRRRSTASTPISDATCRISRPPPQSRHGIRPPSSTQPRRKRSRVSGSQVRGPQA
jgi:hypothetical protein